MTAPSEMLERAATAICAVDETLEWDSVNEAAKDDYRNMARAVLEAIREPTDAMMEKGALELAEHEMDYADAQLVWQAMLDQILGTDS